MTINLKKKFKEKEKEGISLRKIQLYLIIGSVVFFSSLIFFSFYFSASIKNLTEASDQHIEFRKDALELMDASDYLTENAQRFTVQGERRFLRAYFEEALTLKRREKAIEKMEKGSGDSVALRKLKRALTDSVELMNREYYAMRLVIDAKGYTDYPEALESVELTKGDKALSPEEKMSLATKIVLDNDYYMQKNQIRNDMKASLEALEKEATLKEEKATNLFNRDLIFVRVIIVLQTLGVIFLVWLTSRLGIHPILDAVDRIKSNKKISESGTLEFRYLVQAYNRMYEVYKKSLERLNFKASHDELTKVYNRSGYESIINGIDISNSYMILVDIDDFKSINDTYGHETGDKALIKTAEALKKNFRSDDYICRIGGDEFVVFMLHANEKDSVSSISRKIENINRELDVEEDGVPAISLSVGIVKGNKDDDEESLFARADEAMYKSKQRGKNRYTFA